MIGLMAITAIPTVTGVAFGVSEQRKANTRMQDEKRMRKFFLNVFCEGDTEKAKKLNGMRAVMRDNKVYLDYAQPDLRKIPSHTAAAFFIAYPDDECKPGDGLVSTISDDPPMLNWIYVDKNTFELKYGNRSQSIGNIVGHWDWTEDESGLILQKKELWMAVEEEEDVWALYCDVKGDGLAAVADAGKTVIEISIDRDLLPVPKPPPEDGGENKT